MECVNATTSFSVGIAVLLTGGMRAGNLPSVSTASTHHIIYTTITLLARSCNWKNDAQAHKSGPGTVCGKSDLLF
jgi:hypothetical protein